MNILNFYKVLRGLVKNHSQTSINYEQIQTFAVIRSLQDLNTDNLSKLDSDYFYSRLHQQSGDLRVTYPAMVVLPVSGQVRFPFSSSPTRCQTMLISWLYPNKDKSPQEICQDCDPLIIEEIYTRMEDLAFYTLAYLKDLRVYDNGADKLYLSKLHFDAEQTAGNYGSATENIAETQRLQKQFKQDNGSPDLRYHDDISINMLCGVQMTFTFCQCTSYSYAVDLDNTDCCG